MSKATERAKPKSERIRLSINDVPFLDVSLQTLRLNSRLTASRRVAHAYVPQDGSVIEFEYIGDVQRRRP